ncbi:MAG: hypothetical protein QXS05_03070 [Candidatus Bathyarchaeia archaeon]
MKRAARKNKYKPLSSIFIEEEDLLKTRFSTRLLPILFLASCCLITYIVAAAQPHEEFIYYGHAPSRIHRLIKRTAVWGGELPDWTLENGSLATEALLVLIGNHENTAVKVELIPGKDLIAEHKLSKLEMRVVPILNGTFFKVTSNKPVTLIMLGASWLVGADEKSIRNSTLLSFTINTFFTSTDGSYIGKEFIFLAVQPLVGLPYNVFALEDSEIEIYDESGSKISSFKLSANEAKALAFTAGKIYRLTSTGYVMLQSFGNDMRGLCAYPSAKGGFSGSIFYGCGFTPANWHGEIVETEIVITGEKGTKITVYDLKNRAVSETAEIGEDFSLSLSKTVQPYIRIDSDGRITVVYYIHGIKGGHIDTETPGGGITYIGLRAGERKHIYVPWETGFIFASKNTEIEIDGTLFRITADYYYQLTPGLHEIHASEDIMILLVGYPYVPANQGLPYFGICIPPIQAIGLSYEALELKPVSEKAALALTPNLTLYIAIAAAVVIIASLAIWKRI